MATAVLQTRIDTATKQEAETLFDSLGLDMTTAIRLFLRQAINQQKIPFDIVPPRYDFSGETLAAIDEARRISKDSSVKSYSTAKELFEDCE